MISDFTVDYQINNVFKHVCKDVEEFSWHMHALVVMYRLAVPAAQRAKTIVEQADIIARMVDEHRDDTKWLLPLSLSQKLATFSLCAMLCAVDDKTMRSYLNANDAAYTMSIAALATPPAIASPHAVQPVVALAQQPAARQLSSGDVTPTLCRHAVVQESVVVIAPVVAEQQLPLIPAEVAIRVVNSPAQSEVADYVERSHAQASLTLPSEQRSLPSIPTSSVTTTSPKSSATRVTFAESTKTIAKAVPMQKSASSSSSSSSTSATTTAPTTTKKRQAPTSADDDTESGDDELEYEEECASDDDIFVVVTDKKIIGTRAQQQHPAKKAKKTEIAAKSTTSHKTSSTHVIHTIVPGQPFVCPCGVESANHDAHLRHVAKQHKNCRGTTHPCTYKNCVYFANTQRMLDSHLQHVHDEPGKAGVCSYNCRDAKFPHRRRTFCSRGGYIAHMRSKHGYNYEVAARLQARLAADSPEIIKEYIDRSAYDARIEARAANKAKEV